MDKEEQCDDNLSASVLKVDHAVDHVEVDDDHGVLEVEHAVDHVEVD
jgi:hypothetical protein